MGVNASSTGMVTLGRAPLSDTTVTMSSSNPSAIAVSSPVTVPAGQSSASFTYNGIAQGSATLTATASGYTTGTAQVTDTDQTISLGAVSTLAPGGSAGIPLSLAYNAPTGGTTITLASSDTSVATVSPSTITIPAGQKLPSSNPTVTAVGPGTATITATATGYSQGSSTINVALTASLSTTSITLPIGTVNTTLSISGAAPSGGVTFSVTSSNTAAITVPATVTVPAGNTSVQVPITDVAAGSATITFTAPHINTLTQNDTVVTGINTSATQRTGVNLTNSIPVGLAVAPTSAKTITVTNSNPAVAAISANQSTLGSSATVTFSGVTDAANRTLYVQGLSQGTTTLTLSAPGYDSTTSVITVLPSGFNLSTGSISTSTFSAPALLSVSTQLLDNNGNVQGSLPLNPGASVTVLLTSSNPSVGTVPASVTLGAGSMNATFDFTPVGAGTTNITLMQPGGYAMPVQGTSTTATVTAPGISTASQRTGVSLYTSTYAALSTAPPSARTITVTNSNPAVLAISVDETVLGSGSTLTFPNVADSFARVFYVQGLAAGMATLTISAPGYETTTSTVTVLPSGLVLTQGSFSTTTFSSPNSVGVVSVFTDGNGNVQGSLPLSPGVSATVPLASANTGVGTVPASVTLSARSNQANFNFTPAGAGTTTISLTTPAGFTAPVAGISATATVTAPAINVTSEVRTGANLSNSTYVQLNEAPPSARNITITNSNPAVVVLSADPNVPGSGASLTFNNVNDTYGHYYYIQGLSVGTAVLTISAPGYKTTTTTITVYPSSFVFSTGGFNTTTFSGPTTVSVYSIYVDNNGYGIGSLPLNPGVSATVTLGSSNTGVGSVPASLTIQGGTNHSDFNFVPGSAGTTNLLLTLPTGYATPVGGASAPVTVTAPTIGVNDYLRIANGANYYDYAALQVAPPSPVDITVTTNGPGVALISANEAGPYSTSVTFHNVTVTSGNFFYVQGAAAGSTTLTVTAAGYQTANVNVTITP